jgi:hypothetical protein
MTPGTDIPALNLVPFCVRSHYNNPEHASAAEKKVRGQAEKFDLPVYAINDYTSLTDGQVEIVGEGEYLKLP